MTKAKVRTVALSALAVAYVLFLFLFEPRMEMWFTNFLAQNRAMGNSGAFICKAVVFSCLYYLIILLICKISGMKREDFGLAFGNVKRGIRWIAFAIVYEISFELLDWKVLQNIPTWYDDMPQFASGVLFQLPNAFLEELVNRSIMITLLVGVFCGRPFKSMDGANVWSKVAAVAVTSILFGLAHMHITIFPFRYDPNYLQAILTGITGALLGACYLRTKSVYWCGIMHFTINMTIHLFATAIIYIYFGGVVPS